MTPANKPLLVLKGVSAQTPAQRTLFSELSFSLGSGELLCIEGENGSGKTTLIQTILGLRANFSGLISRALSNDQISYLPQLGNLKFFLRLTIRDVVSLHGSWSDSQILAIGLLGEETLSLAWNTASGGEKQKALLTRIFLGSAHLIALDEPFNHLDTESRLKVCALIKNGLTHGLSFILVSHDLQLEGVTLTSRIRLASRELL